MRVDLNGELVGRSTRGERLVERCTINKAWSGHKDWLFPAFEQKVVQRIL